jgi:hypothetical protein
VEIDWKKSVPRGVTELRRTGLTGGIEPVMRRSMRETEEGVSNLKCQLIGITRATCDDMHDYYQRMMVPHEVACMTASQVKVSVTCNHAQERPLESV